MLRKKPTARDVAERAGVSRSLVSMYLRKNPNLWISEQTRKRLDEAIRELGYRPNRSAQILREGKSRVAGVVLGGISGTFASCLSEALMEKMEDAGYRIILGITRYDPEREHRVLESMMNQEMDVLFYTLEPEYVKDLLLQCAESIPVVISEKRPNLPFHSVCFELEGAFQKALRFLDGQNVRRVALMTNRIGFGEQEFFALKGNDCPQLRSFRFDTSAGNNDIPLQELLRFAPDAVISPLGIQTETVRRELGSRTLWIDSWSLPFQRQEEGFHPAGTIVRPFRQYVETLSNALLEAIQFSERTPRNWSIPAVFLQQKEQFELREKLLREPYFQSFGY